MIAHFGLLMPMLHFEQNENCFIIHSNRLHNKYIELVITTNLYVEIINGTGIQTCWMFMQTQWKITDSVVLI